MVQTFYRVNQLKIRLDILLLRLINLPFVIIHDSVKIFYIVNVSPIFSTTKCVFEKQLNTTTTDF